MPDNVGLVVVRKYPTLADVEVAKTALESVGIDSVIRGVELLVKPIDVDLATDILAVEGIED